MIQNLAYNLKKVNYNCFVIIKEQDYIISCIILEKKEKDKNF
jgi:hypothetical protein